MGFLLAPLYLDLPYGTYFCRCSTTLDNTKIFAFLVEKCRSVKLSDHVVGYFRRFGRAFLALKNGFGYIRRNSGLPKKVVLMQNLFIGQKAEIKHLLKRQV